MTTKRLRARWCRALALFVLVAAISIDPVLAQAQAPACAERIINESIAKKVYHLLYGATHPRQAPVDLSLEGHVLMTPGRVRILGRLDYHYKHVNTRFFDTFDSVLFDVATDAPGCVITHVNLTRNHLGNAHGVGDGVRAIRFYGHYSGLPPTQVPISGSQEGNWPIVNRGLCTMWVLASQAGKIGCELWLAPMKIAFRPGAQDCTRTPFLNPVSDPSRFWSDVPKSTLSGDSRFAGELSVSLEGNFAVSEQGSVWRRTRISIQELGGDRSLAGGLRDFVLFTEKDFPGCIIRGIEGDTSFAAYSRVPPIVTAGTFSVQQTRPVYSYPDKTAAWCVVIGYIGCHEIGWQSTRALMIKLAARPNPGTPEPIN